MSAQTPGMPGLAQGALYPAAGNGSTGLKTNSAPGTPRPTINTQVAPQSPSLQRRSSAQLHRSGSSDSPRLNRKASRSSLGSPPVTHEDNQRRPTPKRSISNLITELRGAQATMEAIPEPVILTAPEIAAECFRRDLAAHDETTAETVVLLHDACYGHRYSRLKSSARTLSSIVERPERLLASVLGVATTYVRTGGYHAGERNAPHPKHTPAIPPFTVRRTMRTLDIKSSFVTNVHGTEWMAELNGLCEIAGTKLAAGEKEVTRLPSSAAKDKRALHEGDLYLCQESLDAFQGALGGVADAVDAVFLPTTDTKRAFVAVRPPGHHCSADYPSGFCWINNVHIGIEYAAQLHNLTHAAIIDFDLHHGDGSQSIAWTRNSRNHAKRTNAKAYPKIKMAPDVGYYSLHDINSYPCEEGDDEKVQAASLCVHNAHGQSIWNVHLQPWRTLEEFWALYESRYLVLLEKAKEFLQHHTARIQAEGRQRPKSAVFISAGFDASEHEGVGMQRHKVNVPTDFYARFTEDIMKLAETEGTSCDGRVISVLEGGYSDRALCSSTMSHLSALCASQNAPASNAKPTGGLAASMQADEQLDQQMRGLTLIPKGAYDSAWWSDANLTALEHHINPPPPVSAGGKKVRAGPHPTYATPTESFAYKVIDPAKFARSVSGTLRDGAPPTRAATPPPPEVDWIVAAHELSKLLTPSDRTTRSNTAEDLAGSKIKKERASSAELVSPDELGKPRQLRTRGKAAAPIPAQGGKRVVSSADRRRTMADLPSTAAEVGPISIQPRRASRRSSLASTVSTTSAIPDATAPPVPALPSQRTVAPTDGVQVKKSRPTPSTPASKARRAPPSTVPRGQSASMLTSEPVPATGESLLHDPNVDELASGMKRINLKVGTREESERKAKEKLDADRRARALKGAETRRLNKAAKDAKAAQEKAGGGFPVNTQPVNPGQTLDLNASNATTAAHQGFQPVHNAQTTHLSEPPATHALLQHDQTQPQMDMQHQQVQYYPSYGGAQDNVSAYPQDNSVVSYEQAMMLPDISSYDDDSALLQPATNPSRQLPVFTSTGHIPFAAPGFAAHQSATPQYQQQESGLHYPIEHAEQERPVMYHPHQGQPGLQQSSEYGQPELQTLHAYDVWAVPDTPSKQTFGHEH